MLFCVLYHDIDEVLFVYCNSIVASDPSLRPRNACAPTNSKRSFSVLSASTRPDLVARQRDSVYESILTCKFPRFEQSDRRVNILAEPSYRCQRLLKV